MSTTTVRRVQLDPKRHHLHHKVAFILTGLTFLLFISLSIAFGENNEAATSNDALSSQRWLEDGDDDADGESDFSQYSCRYIYDKTPNPGYAQCQFARTCNGGEGVWAPFVFCQWKRAGTLTLFLAISPIILLWMITLFRLLGSTAEDFFSPSLEMFSIKLGLPPRFAGVSLLALGNGAADVSATMSAIVNDVENGYKLSLGALTGAAMVVGGMISGVVVIVAGGVPCRGALVRDVTALCITIVVVWTTLSSGEIGPGSISLFLSMYALFVCIVLVADIYHRAVVLPRLQAEQSGEGSEDAANPTDHTAPALTRVMTAISNYDNEGDNAEDAAASGGWGVTSETADPSLQVDPDAPIVLHGQHGILHGDGQGNTQAHQVVAGDDEAGAYTLVQDHIDQVCAGGSTSTFSASNWSGAWHDGKQEVIDALKQAWEDITYNGDLNIGEKFLLICEFPFTVMRKLTVPIPCEGYYNRGMVSLSVAVSPLWFAYYIWDGHEINLLSKHSLFYFLLVLALAFFVAALVLRFAPSGEGNMAMGVATPLALYGFIMAATWIDFVADHLVDLLDFMGIVMHIPGAVMGLTVLAWGNSMADLSANITMARKGLANMAMTACFAGPVFNILIGLGLGFWSLAAKTEQPEASVSLSPPVTTGFVFVILNCISILATGICLGKGRIESYYGYIAVTLYTIYVVTSISLQFSKYGDEE